MKTVWAIILLFYCTAVYGQGTDCNTAFGLILDGVCRNYTISTTTGTAGHCTNGIYAGTGRLTIFKFTTNATASCVLINLTTSGFQPAECMLYTSCTGGGALHFPDDNSSVCFNDGTGLWAPSEAFVLTPNTVYYLRVWTPGPGTITMCAKNYDPPNNFCSGATTISSTPLSDNNACHKPSQEVAPSSLCAFSLQNTAFYSYTTEFTGTSTITIGNIKCDNSALAGSSGFQIGFFTGNCGSLVPLNCFYDTGTVVQANTSVLPGGTQVTVAIDGMLGSNCTYDISAFNAITLPARLKYFSGWKKQNSNSLKWLTLTEENSCHFEIEKSTDRVNFFKIATIAGKNAMNTETSYSFEDTVFSRDQYYRLKIIGANGKFIYSNVARIKRDDATTEVVTFQHYASDKLVVKVSSSKRITANIFIIDALGRERKIDAAEFNKGENSYTIDIKYLNKGVYYLTFFDDNGRKQWSFMKL